MRRKKRQQLPAGPGRPRKWDEELVDLFMKVPKSYKERFDAEKGSRTRTEYFVDLMDHRNKSVLDLMDKINILEKQIQELLHQLEEKDKVIAQKDKIIARQNKIIEEKDRKIERLEEKIRRLQLQIQALKLGSKTVVRDAIKLKTIAEKIEEGKSWKEVCALAGFRDEDKIRDYLRMAFDIRRNDRDEWPEVFKPKDIVEEFQGWVLVKPSEKADIISYVFVRKGREKAFLEEQKLKAEPEKALEVKDVAAEITKVLKDWLEGYELALMDKHGKERAERMARDFQRFALKRLIDKYGFTAVFDVVYSDPHFKRVILPLLEFYAPKEEKEAVAE